MFVDEPVYVFSLVIWPFAILLLIGLLIGLFFFVLKMPKDLGIYLGWLPSFAFLMLTIFLSILFLIPLVLTLAVFITGTALRIDKNKKTKEREERKLKEIDKMSINDL